MSSEKGKGKTLTVFRFMIMHRVDHEWSRLLCISMGFMEADDIVGLNVFWIHMCMYI